MHLNKKSTIEEIRKRFDHDVERFSNLDTGQTATIDAPLAMELITRAAVSATPVIRRCLDWDSTFRKIYALLRPGGSFWVTDLVSHEIEKVDALMWQRYADYLIEFGGSKYQQDVFAYIEREDSPRPVTFQLELMRKVGFAKTEILHKNSCFAAFGAIKGQAVAM